MVNAPWLLTCHVVVCSLASAPGGGACRLDINTAKKKIKIYKEDQSLINHHQSWLILFAHMRPLFCVVCVQLTSATACCGGQTTTRETNQKSICKQKDFWKKHSCRICGLLFHINFFYIYYFCEWCFIFESHIQFFCTVLGCIQLDSQLNWDFMGNAKAIKDIFGAIKIIADPHKVIFPGQGLGFCYIYLQPLGLQEKMKKRLLKM